MGQGHIRVVLARDPTNQDRSLIPLLLADCDIPLEIRRFVYVDYRNETAVAWQNLLLALLKDPGPSEQAVTLCRPRRFQPN